jgi:anti-anti-sigma factor
MGGLNTDVLTHKKEQWTELELDTQSIDYRNADALKATIASQVKKSNTDILLNLEQVSFMDSAGLVMLIQAKRTCEEKQCSFFVANAQPYVQQLLEFMN